ncbi:MAG: filamentous hemagglutinin N-terminal domain-containing protein, partial [Lentisphaeraceae bacterium]|nr:filamentous hemagglutinin N-terminal domain-containing protein [Lentisphaeraceae bacterium]
MLNISFIGKRKKLRILLSALMLFSQILPLMAEPQGGEVVRGNASIQQSGNVTNIRVNSQNGAINWKSFNLNRNETVNIHQASASSRLLNRINGSSPSMIDGTINANGNVYFINPAGVYFGQNSVINVGGLFAAAGNISNDDFMAGINRFTGIEGDVINRGQITADGSAHFIGKRVENIGLVESINGFVSFSSGTDVLIAEEGSSLHVKIEQNSEAAQESDKAAIDNSGTIKAKKGINLGSGDIYSLALNNTGLIASKEIKVDGANGDVQVAGKVDASNENGVGGTIHLLGNRVALIGAEVDASGTEGGGEILIGGDFQGKNSDIRNAFATLVTSNTSIKADATVTGDGGKVIIWSDDTTIFNGSISATGGSGGFVEVSGKINLELQSLDIATGGGVLLFDPTNINIGSTGTDNVELSDDEIEVGDRSGDTLEIEASHIVSLLESGNTLVLQATNQINVLEDIIVTSNNESLTLVAADVVLSADITLNSNAVLTIVETGSNDFNFTNDINVGGLVVESNGNITDSNNVTITTSGVAEFDSITGSILIGDESGNVINFDQLTINSSGSSNITEDSQTELVGTSIVGGDLILVSSGTITDGPSGTLTVSGNANLNAGSNDIILGNNGGNAINVGSLTFVGDNVNISVVSGGAMTGASSASSLTALPINIFDNASLDVTADDANLGSVEFRGNSSINITNGDLTLSGISGNGGGDDNLTLFASADLSIGDVSNTINNLNLIGDLSVGDIAISGNLSVIDDVGGFDDSSLFTIGGTSSFDLTTNTNDLTLNNGSNSFGGAVSFSNINDATIVSTSNLEFSSATDVNEIIVTTSELTLSSSLTLVD